MGCSKCGGKKTLVVERSKTNNGSEVPVNDMVKIQYVGPEAQTRTFSSKFRRGVRYRINRKKPVYVFPEDAEWMLKIKYFKEIKELPPESLEEPMEVVEENNETSIYALDLRPETLAVLSKHFSTVEELNEVTDADLLSIKGIGKARLEKIRQAALNG